jgi:hypothetical protein
VIGAYCREYKAHPATALHEIPLSQLLALVATAAWANGMEPENGAYEEWEFDRELARIKERDRQARSKPWPADQGRKARPKKTESSP